MLEAIMSALSTHKKNWPVSYCV